jgi:hypothetical protein
MEDPSFKLNGIHVLNVILEYFYIGLLLMCFILALGNRPQGSKLGYTLAFIGFALITVYMTVSLVFRRSQGPTAQLTALPSVRCILHCLQRHSEYPEYRGQVALNK